MKSVVMVIEPRVHYICEQLNSQWIEVDKRIRFLSLLTQDVVLTSIQRRLNVVDVRWTLKRRCVLTGLLFRTDVKKYDSINLK